MCCARVHNPLFERSSLAWARLGGRLLTGRCGFSTYALSLCVCEYVCCAGPIGEKLSLDQRKNLGDRRNCEMVCGKDGMQTEEDISNDFY